MKKSGSAIPLSYAVVAILIFLSGLMAMPMSSGNAAHGYSSTARADGREVFLKYKCDNCHSVSTAGITQKVKTKAPDLVNVTVRHKKDGGKAFVHKYIRLEQNHESCPKVEKAHDGRSHTGGRFKGSKEEEDLLVDWLDQQRGSEK